MSTDPDHFDRLYADSPDPWDYETSDYEAAKYAACLDLLPQVQFRSGLELGCSIGVLSARLAERCDRFLGVDGAEEAIRQACARDLPNAEFRLARLPDGWPAGTFDLIVLSEVLYFFDRDDIDRLSVLTAGSLAPGGTVLLANYLGDTQTELDGRAAEALFLDRLALRRPYRERRRITEPEYQAVTLKA